MHRHRLLTTATGAVSHRGIVIGVCLGLILVAEAAMAALTPHEEYIAQWRSLGSQGDMKACEDLLASFLNKAEAYIQKHPNGAEIVQAKLNKALAIGLYGQRNDEASDELLAVIIAEHPESPLIPEAMFYRSYLRIFAFDGEQCNEKREIALKLVRRFPTSAKAPLALTLAAHSYFVDAGDMETAVTLHKRVLDEYPGTVAELDARRDLINIAIEQDEYESARAQITDALEREHELSDSVPADRWVWFVCADLGAACEQIEDWNRAEEIFNAVVEANPDTEMALRAQAELIHVAIDKGDIASALEQIDSAFDKYGEPPDGVPCATWAKLLRQRIVGACGRAQAWGRAEECCKAILNVFPDGEEAIEANLTLAWVLARGSADTRAGEEAAILLDVAKQSEQPARARYALMRAGDCYEWRVHDKGKAKAVYRRVIAGHPGTREELEARIRLIVMSMYEGSAGDAEEAIRAYDSRLGELADTELARHGQLLIARALYSFSRNNPSRVDVAGRALKRFQAIIDEHPDTGEAFESLRILACHYAIPAHRNESKATEFALRFLRSDPQRNAHLYAAFVGEIMQNRSVMLEPLRTEMPGKALALVNRYAEAPTVDRAGFVRRADSWYGADEVKKMVDRIVEFADRHNKPELKKDALLFLAEAYLRKERAEEALVTLRQIEAAGLDLTDADRVRVDETRAFSYLWRGKPAMAVPHLDRLIAIDTTSLDSEDRERLRTQVYYEYWRAVAAFDMKRYAEAHRLFDGIETQYPDTPWGSRASRFLKHLNPLLEAQTASGS